jgi:hypothetical protein
MRRVTNFSGALGNTFGAGVLRAFTWPETTRLEVFSDGVSCLLSGIGLIFSWVGNSSKACQPPL